VCGSLKLCARLSVQSYDFPRYGVGKPLKQGAASGAISIWVMGPSLPVICTVYITHMEVGHSGLCACMPVTPASTFLQAASANSPAGFGGYNHPQPRNPSTGPPISWPTSSNFEKPGPISNHILKRYIWPHTGTHTPAPDNQPTHPPLCYLPYY
jgi:hypothetical protein